MTELVPPRPVVRLRRKAASWPVALGVAVVAGFAVVSLSAQVLAIAVALAETLLPESWLRALTPPAILFGVLLMLFVWPMSVVWVYKVMRWRDETWDGAACWACGYNLTGNTSGVCPECGTRLYDFSAEHPVRVHCAR